MKFQLEIELGDALNGNDIAAILRSNLAIPFTPSATAEGQIRGANGSVLGKWGFADEPSREMIFYGLQLLREFAINNPSQWGEFNPDAVSALQAQYGPPEVTRTNHDGSITTSHTDRDENIAAIAAEFHADRTMFDAFYQAHGATLDGFPGIWRYCIDAADAFTAAEAELTDEGSFEYPEAIFDYVKRLQHDHLITGAELRTVAAEAIKAASYAT